MQLSIQIGTCLKSCLHGSISKYLLEMILNCYRSCRYRLNLLGICMLHKTTTKQVKELAENQKLKWKVNCEGVSATLRDFASASLSLSSDEESESEEVTICTQSQDETLPSRPQMTFSMYTQGSKG